jgi:ATP-binding cassette subfamily C protein LapB
MKLDIWWNQPAQGDEVLACLASVALHFERPASAIAIRGGMLLDEHGRIPFDQIGAALHQIGLRSRARKQRLQRWRADDLPAILPLEGGRAVVLHGIDGGQGEIELPFMAGRTRVQLSLLETIVDGDGLVIAADPRAERAHEQPWNGNAPKHWFWSEVREMRGQFGYVLAAALAINLLAFAMPLFTMNVYDRIIPNRAATSLWVLAIGVGLAMTFEFTLRLARTRLLDEVARTLDARFSQRLFEKLLNLPLAVRRGSTGAMARRVSDYEQVRDFFASTMVVLCVDLAFLVLFLIMISVIGGWLALVPLASITLMALAGFARQGQIGRTVSDAQADASLQHSALVEALGGMETIKACRGEGRMLGRWRRYAASNAETQERLRNLTAMAVNLASLCQQGTSVALMLGGFYLFDAGQITMGGIIAIIMLSSRSLSPVGQLAFLMTRGKQALATMASLQDLIEQSDERDLGSRQVAPVIEAGRIELQDVEFRYPDSPLAALNGINLRIEPGERIGLVGRVASGKSTLGRVLCGLYEPTGGAVLLDGLDSRQYSPHQLRGALRFVGQDAELFSGTVRDNLVFGAGEVTDEQLLDAVTRSGASGFVGRDASGFDFHVGERGRRLSGGQRSFLVLARALVEPCHLLFLDEPTGAMDAQTEQVFVEHLARALRPDQTLLVSTHRNALLQAVDRLIVIDGGRIVADGPRDAILGHAELKVA